MTQCKPLPPVELLRELFDYDPQTGVVIYRTRPNKWSKTGPGDIVGTKNAGGYMVVTVRRKSYRLNRVIWKLVTGVEPSSVVEHENRNRSDNTWSNLRLATYKQNAGNKISVNNGVTPGKGKGTWKAQFAGTSKTFNTQKEAHQAYVQWHLSYFGEFSIYAES